MAIANFLNYRPLSVLAIIIAVRGIVYGIGFAGSEKVYTSSRLWDILVESPIDPVVFGWAVLVLNVFLVVAFLIGKDILVQLAGYSNAVAYMFITAAFVGGHEYISAYTQGFVWTLAIGFLTFIYLHRFTWIGQERGVDTDGPIMLD